MHVGQVISGAAHVGLIGWLIFGGAFQSEPLPFEVSEVSVISTDAFEALLSDGPQPAAPTDVALPQEPEVVPDPVETPAPDPDVTAVQPEPTPEPEPETLPEPPAPEPEPEIVDEAPSLPTPETPAIDAPEVAETPVPEASDRVAPEVVEAPDPDATPDVVEQEAVTNDAGGETQAEEQEATAPEEASDQIVTEAEEPSGAPQSSIRPPSRRPSAPTRTAEADPAPATEADPDPEPQSDTTADAVNDALAGILGGGEEEVVPQGPPLSNGEKEALRVAVSACWNVGSLSTEALGTTVVVGVDMEQSGKPIIASIRLLSSSGGSQSAANQAFEAARRAIIRCTRDGYALPAEKYGQWQEIEMTFNPERMRIK
ncbi:energy transducer TonB [Tateyamaria sp. SN6-1]|uniref:energy transducer TonB n=1 Tax=Tateyamaria sp. SN6-1 TaxID=3092148 RepID=UPI0039F566B1